MLGKLRRKFVAMIMAVVTVALAVMFATMAALTVQQAFQQLDDDLSVAIDMASDARRTATPSHEALPGQREPRDGQLQDGREGQGFDPPRIGKGPEGGIQTPVAVYALTDGALQLASRSGAALDADVLEAVAQQCADAPDGKGALPDQGLVFLKRDVAGTAYVAFADDAAAEALRNVLLLSVGVGVPALLFFLAVAIAFSRWATRPVQAAWDRQREFVTNASHELKTPLSVIKADTEVLLEEPGCTAEERMRWLASTKEAAEGLEGLVEDLLALASLDEAYDSAAADAAPSEEGSFDASRVVEGSVLKFEARAIEAGFSLQSHIEEGICSDVGAQRLGRLSDLLLDNACKYVDEGGCVSVGFARASGGKGSGRAEFFVTNTGEGIPPDKLARVFDRFYRADEARDTNKGHGLGLSLAKALSDQMGAGLSVESASGLTTFRFSVPLANPGK